MQPITIQFAVRVRKDNTDLACLSGIKVKGNLGGD